MKRYRFKLESVERVRAIREREALGELAKIRSLLTQGEAFKASLERAIEDALVRREKLGSGEIATATDFLLLNSHLTGLRQRLTQATRLLGKIKKEELKTLDAYLKAKQRLSAIEKLREKSFSEYRQASRKEEAKNAEDLITMRHRLRKEAA